MVAFYSCKRRDVYTISLFVCVIFAVMLDCLANGCTRSVHKDYTTFHKWVINFITRYRSLKHKCLRRLIFPAYTRISAFPYFFFIITWYFFTSWLSAPLGLSFKKFISEGGFYSWWWTSTLVRPCQHKAMGKARDVCIQCVILISNSNHNSNNNICCYTYLLVLFIIEFNTLGTARHPLHMA